MKRAGGKNSERVLLYAVQLIQGIQYVTFALILGGMLALNRKNRSIFWFFFNYVLGSIGLALTLGKSFEPPWLSNVLNLEIPQIRYGLLHVALICFIGRHRETRWVAVVLALAALPFYVAWQGSGYGDPAFSARNFLVLDVALAVQTALSAWLLLQSNEAATRVPRVAMSAFLAVYSGTEFLRLIVQLATSRAPAVASPLLETASITVYVIASSATPLAFIWLLNARLTEDLKRQSILDPLTQIFNRRGLREISERDLARCQRSGQSFALAVADVDNFKQLNDTFGHSAGDAVLRDVAELLQRMIRRNDTVARIGGEEFVILLPEADADNAVLLVERLRETIEAYAFPIRESSVSITVSFGVTVTRGRPDISLDGLVEEADTSLYAAKQAGRNRTRLYVPPALAPSAV